MKKHLKRLAVTVTVLFAFLGAGFTVAFASGYIDWDGTGDYNKLISNLDLFRSEGIKIIEDRDAVIAARDEKITELDGEITTLKGKVTTLENTSKADKEKLAGIKSVVEDTITSANNEGGKGVKFDILQLGVNNLANSLGIESTVASPGATNNGKNAQLEQAVEDMEDARLKSDALLKELKSIPKLNPESTE